MSRDFCHVDLGLYVCPAQRLNCPRPHWQHQDGHSALTFMPQWPSLYDLSLEIRNIANEPAIQPGATYLTNAADVFRFTLYWSLVFNTPLYSLCAIYAFFNIAIPPKHPVEVSSTRKAPPKTNLHRTRYTFALFVVFSFCAAAVLAALLAGSIIGFILFAFFKAASFNMST